MQVLAVVAWLAAELAAGDLVATVGSVAAEHPFWAETWTCSEAASETENVSTR